jgi:hypothetical protein
MSSICTVYSEMIVSKQNRFPDSSRMSRIHYLTPECCRAWHNLIEYSTYKLKRLLIFEEPDLSKLMYSSSLDEQPNPLWMSRVSGCDIFK